MKLRIMSFLLIFVMLLSCAPFYSYALEYGNQTDMIDDPAENEEDILASPNVVTKSSWNAAIMQGDTVSASDCGAFEDAITSCNNSYDYFARYGWEYPADKSDNIVSKIELLSARYYDVAYYSGHGGSASDGGASQPCLNYNSSNAERIFIASAFDIAESDWTSTTVIRPSNSLRVLVLASCSQLDDTNAKYYARLMKVSGIRAIPGYYSTAPSDGDDTIASNFVGNCNNGNSVASAWGNANSGKAWAVLVYFSNNNQYYHLPGFPGATYSTPASNADVYIVKQSAQNTVVTAAQPGTGGLLNAVAELPLTILTSDSTVKTAVEEFSREVVWTNAVPDGESVVRKALASEVSDIDNKLLVEYHLTKEVVDPDMGVLSETSEIIERTYRYYDTFNGIKIADSFAEGSVDGQGLSRITVQKKTVVSGTVAASVTAADAAARGKTVSDTQACKLLITECPSLAEEEIQSVSLAYAPDGSGNNVLAYEFLIGGGFYYVSVTAGEVLWF